MEFEWGIGRVKLKSTWPIFKSLLAGLSFNNPNPWSVALSRLSLLTNVRSPLSINLHDFSTKP